ncbi:hypothetical protein AA313_de0208994 [Arthrobotrys entomopaga]|nr:hypothetical protein AA313_de0208994 [Arthrobotrys entomopaga]
MVTSVVTLKSVEYVNNPAKYTDNYQLRITFGSTEALKNDISWKLLYIASPNDVDAEQELEEVLAGPVPIGDSTITFEPPAPNTNLIPAENLLGVAALILVGSYNEREFIRVGYYQNTQYMDENMNENPPAVPVLSELTRDINNKPRITRIQINWDEDSNASTAT